MENLRTPFQGVWNIVRFNWHYYVAAFFLIVLLIYLMFSTGPGLSFYAGIVCCLVIILNLISLGTSYYIYDVSNLYRLDWLGEIDIKSPDKILNISAGFDETSTLLACSYKDAELLMIDFYDPIKHTEISIKRARKAYPPDPKIIAVKTSHLPFQDSSIDLVFALLSAHEIRDSRERQVFFEELRRVVKPEGKVVIMEHLRDLPNFLAYTVGFFHFYSKSSWLQTFKASGLHVSKEIKVTPFISTFIAKPHGNTP